jgi:hypothetical protein
MRGGPFACRAQGRGDTPMTCLARRASAWLRARLTAADEGSR